QLRDTLRRPGRGGPPEEFQLQPCQDVAHGVEAGGEGTDAFPLLEPSEERDAFDPLRCNRLGRWLAGGGRASQVWDYARVVGQVPALCFHPGEQVRAGAHDDVGKLDTRLLEHADRERSGEDAWLPCDVGDPLTRPVAIHDEKGALKAEP